MKLLSSNLRKNTLIPPIIFCFSVGVLALGSITMEALAAKAKGGVEAKVPTEDTLTLNFQNAEIEAVIKAIGEITGQNFLLDPRVKGTVNIVSTRPIARNLVYPTLLSALRTQGFAAVETNGVIKIVPESEAKLQAAYVGGGEALAVGGQLVTRVYPLRYESAQQILNVLRPMVSANNLIAAYPGANTLIITDYSDNLQRIERVLESLDQPPAAEPEIIAIRYASAVDLAYTLTKLYTENTVNTSSALAEPAQRITILPDERTNSLIVRVDNPTRLSRIKNTIAKLDVAGSAGLGNIRIVYLKNAEATKVAQTLRLVIGGESTGSTGTYNALTNASPAYPGSAGTAANNAVGTASPNINNPTPSPSNNGSSGFAATGITVQADSANNALIIAAPEPVYNNLRLIIEKLDVRRAQIYVEALVAEVTAEKVAEFGIQWQNLDGVNRGNLQGIGGTNFGARGAEGHNIIDATSNLMGLSPGLNIGLVRGQVTLPGVGTIFNLGLLARALEADANANILSMPTLLALDNEEARIVIGQNVPFITGQYAQTGTATTPTPFQTIERRDVGLVLRIKPQITEGGTVKLVIYQEVSSLQDKPLAGASGSGPVTNKRSLESTVLVDDSQIIALGGLIQDSLSDGSDRVPILGALPFLGNFFRYDTRKNSKTNLMVFLRPRVIRSAVAAEGYSRDRYDYIVGQQKAVQPEPRTFLPDFPLPKLPEFPASLPLPAQ